MFVVTTKQFCLLCRMYRAVGPALATLGVTFLFSACVYYYCYSSDESNRLKGGGMQVSEESRFAILVCKYLCGFYFKTFDFRECFF